MGSVDKTDYSIPNETASILNKGIVNNPLIPKPPKEIQDAIPLVKFTGSARPSIPINWRFAESIAALKAYEAAMVNVLRSKKYNVPMSEVTIDTDHASLFVTSPFLAYAIDEEGKPTPIGIGQKGGTARFGFPDGDLHRAFASMHRSLASNIYQTNDGRWYHTHGSMNPDPTIKALGMQPEGQPDDKYDDVWKRYQEKVRKHESHELDNLMNEDYKQAGTISYSADEFFASEHGKANAGVGLYEIEKVGDEGASQPASWWPENASMPSSPSRPLAGLKVVDLTRVIAAPTITRSLAELGASVMRVTGPNVTDLTSLHPDLNWGKWNCHLDLNKNPQDREKLAALIKDADVVVEGYRPGAMARNGFGREDVLELVKGRDRGIIFARENCYGWHGPWMHRSGWQQISDACCGVSLAYGRAMGNDEAVTPVFPNSDCCTGVIGCIGILHALIRRSEEGGSYFVDSALNYYSQWLVKSVGTYPENIWADLWQHHGKPVFRHYHAMSYTVPAMFKLLHENSEKTIFNPDFFERRTSKAVGHEFIHVKPIAQYKDGAVQLKYNVGSRGNGVDQPRWPEDLTTEIVA